MKIIIDPSIKTIPTDFSWQECIGDDHAKQLMRTDFVRDLKTVHDELGIKQVRFHGIFDDDMLTIQAVSDMIPTPGANNIVERSFRQCGMVYDNVLSAGMKPYVELSFMPKQLAKGKRTGLHYKNNICPPKDFAAWGEYIGQFTRFLLERYGKEEVETWYFEVWNEPDLGGFFHGSKEDYYKLYEYTVKAIKKEDEKIRVGGPSTSGCHWVKEFKDYCEQNNLPLDFLSTHHYPGDGFGNSINFKMIRSLLKSIKQAAKEGKTTDEAITAVFFHPETTKYLKKGIFNTLDDKAKEEAGEKPLFISEWANMAVFGSPTNDEKYGACFNIKSCMDLNNTLAGYSYWCCTDTFEEILQLNRPFVGSFGIINQDGINKPAFWAFKILSEVFPARLDLPRRTNENVEYAAFKKGQELQVLVYAQEPDYLKDEKYDVELELEGTYSKASLERIDSEHCNPKAEWVKLGKPQYLTPSQVKEIKEKTCLKKEKVEVQNTDEKTSLSFSLHSNDVYLFTFHE
ncbi:MAG: glycosyl hydrolase [Bacilli bacterium]|jgi:xylan 1,4-beta-xylosidase|nr:glycosyl hydrolase [Bacilli bacterium]